MTERRVYWKNIKDEDFQYLTRKTIDFINGSLQKNFIAEKEGKGTIEKDQIHLNFTKLPYKREREEWEHNTRFKSVKIKAEVGVDIEEITVENVDNIEFNRESIIINGGKQNGNEKTLFCTMGGGRIICELYGVSSCERISEGHIKLTLPEVIEDMKEAGNPPIDIDIFGAVFKIRPLRLEKVDSMIFNDMVLIYNGRRIKQTDLNVLINPSKSQIKSYSGIDTNGY